MPSTHSALDLSYWCWLQTQLCSPQDLLPLLLPSPEHSSLPLSAWIDTLNAALDTSPLLSRAVPDPKQQKRLGSQASPWIIEILQNEQVPLAHPKLMKHDKQSHCQGLWNTHIIPALNRLRQDNRRDKAILAYITIYSQKQPNTMTFIIHGSIEEWYLCIVMCVCMPACACTHAHNRGKKNGHWDHGAGVIGNCGPLNIGVENQTQVLWKSGNPFSWLTHLNSSKKVSHIHTGILYLGAKVQLVKISQVLVFFNVFISLTEIFGVKRPVTI